MVSQAIPPIVIGGISIGVGHPCFVIAEAGVNHNGSVSRAKELIDAAVNAGADAVKFQTFKAEKVVTRTAPKAAYQLRTTSGGQSQYDMLKALELDEQAHGELLAHCERRKILFLSTPFDEDSADLLESLGVAGYKLASGELTNLGLLRHVAGKGKPLIVSTGMATLDETARAVEAVRKAGCRELVLLHCVSNYPADPRNANLRAMQSLRDTFGVPVGFSDHTVGDTVALAAVALGAAVVEKHFTLDRSLPGPDHQASIEPADLATMIERIRTVENALGDGRKAPVASEAEVARVARKSLVAAEAIPAGTVLRAEMVTLRRPGTGLGPQDLDRLVGRTAVNDISEGLLLVEDMFR